MILLLAVALAARRPAAEVGAVALAVLAPIPFLLVALVRAAIHAIHAPDPEHDDLAAALRSELTAGRSARGALVAATDGIPHLTTVHRLAAAGADAEDIGQALDAALEGPNGPIVAAAIEASLRHGGQAMPLMAGLVELGREDAELARELEVALAPVRVSMVIVGGLPMTYVADRALRGGLPVEGPERFAVVVGIGAIAAGVALAVILVRRSLAVARRGDDRFARRLWVDLASGVGLVSALASAAEATGHPAGAALRGARAHGLAAVLAAARGEDAPLLRALGRAHRSGAPLLPVVEAHLDDGRRARRARGLAAVRALPVKLTIPVAVCMLPGFVLVAVVPSVVASLRDLVGPLLG